MLRSRRGTLDSIPCSPHGTDTDFERRGSDQSSTSMVLPYRSSTKATWTLPTALSPAPAPASPKLKPERTHVRLRSDSALSMHTSKSSFRHYPDSRSESPMNSPWYWKKGNDIDAASTIDTISLGGTTSVASSDHAHYAGSIPSLFDRAVIKMVLSDPEVGSKLRAFADARGYSVDVDLLVKADQYTGAIDILRGLTEHVSTYLEVPATSTMDTPYTYPLAFKTNTKQCARNALPSLERLYREAKFAAEERLVNDLYPEFVKSQLADRLKASLSVTQSSSTNSFKPTYPGLGSAFCLTDSWKPDNPLVFASEGFMSMYGYERHEVFNNNCRFMQGHLTSGDAVRQIRNAVFTGQEHTELVVNYHKDGTPFWNFLFICPLVEDGIVRYCLGGQVDISKGMGTGHRDILDLLNFETSEAKSVPRTPEEIHECSAQQPIIHIEEPHLTDEKTAAIPRRSHRQRLFDRFLPKKHVPDNSHGESRPKYSTMSMNSRMSPSPTPMDGYVKEWGISNPFHDRHQVEPELLRPPPSTPTPYSCFFVMRYVPSPSTSFHIFPHQTNDKRHSRLPHLPVAFCSAEALDFLGLKGHDPSIVHSRSIFSLLVCATSSTDLVEKTFRSSVLESMAAGESISLEISTLDGPISSTTSTTPSPSPSPTPSSKLSLFSHTRARSRSNVGLGGRDSQTACGRDGALSAAGSEYHRPSTSRLFSDKLKEHGAEKFGNIFRLAGHEKTQGAGGQKQQLKGRKLSSHWTALKDAEGKVAWVVMILTSVAVA